MSNQRIDLKKENKWEVVPYSLGDLAGVGKFFKTQFKGTAPYGSMGYFNWKIYDNIVGRGILNLIKDSEKIIATTSLTPKSLIINGEAVIAGEIGDAYTDSKYQGQGIFSKLANAALNDGKEGAIDLVYATPDESSPSLPIFRKRLNFIPFSAMNLHSLSYKISIGPFLRKKIPWYFADLAGLCSSYMSFIFFTIKLGLVKKYKGAIVETSDTISEDWNTFWQEAISAYDFIFERDAKSITWRYIDNPNEYKFLLLKKNKRLCGYMIYRVISNENDRFITIADYLTLPEYSKGLNNLIKKVVKEAVKIGASSINTWSVEDSDYYVSFQKMGFLKRSTVVPVYFQNGFNLKPVEIDSFHFTMGDTDNV